MHQVARAGFGLPVSRRRTFAWLGAPARDCLDLSLDVRLSPPGFGSLRVRFAFGILPALAPISPLDGLGSPEPPQLETGRRGVTPAVETAYVTSGAMDGAAQAHPSE